MAIFWAVILTGLFAMAVATLVSGKRRRQQIADLYANPGSVDAARLADQAATENRRWGMSFGDS